MERKDNYVLQMQQAKKYFLTYDQQKIIEKCRLEADEEYLYARMLGSRYRLNRTTVNLERLKSGAWVDGNSFSEVMTLLDLLCDSREDRFLTGRWVSIQALGLQFHQNLMEDSRDSLAEHFDREPERLRSACMALGGEPIKGADIGYAVELFDGLKIGILFWHGDEEVAPRLRYMLDENAKMYLKDETMHYALGILRRRLEKPGE